MKKIILISILTIILASCTTTMNLGSRIKQLELGMTKQQTIAILGNAYDVIGSGFTQDGKEETLLFTGLNGPSYVIHFLDNKLVEFYLQRYPQPMQQNVTIVTED